MLQYENFDTEGMQQHVCKSRREGDWFIFECEHCNYVRKWNSKTKEMILVDSGDEDALHSGRYEPPGLQMNMICPN